MSNSKVIKAKQPCPSCTSSDGYHIYDDGHGYCFSCKKYSNSKTNTIIEDSIQFVPLRGITEKTMRFYKARTRVSEDGTPLCISFEYSDTAFKIRDLLTKDFRTKGPTKDSPLFGRAHFEKGQAKAITITEGEFDAMAAHQMLGGYPVVSVRSSSSARSDCQKEFEFLNSFSKIYICFDNDKVGQDAAREVAGIFDMNKVFIVKMDLYKDANEYLEKGHEKEFVNAWWASKNYMPKNVVSSWDEVNEILTKEVIKASAPYPYETLQAMTYGIRTGEVVLVTAQEKVGKTEIIRSIEYHLLKNTEDNIGIIHLEESEKRAVQGLVGYEMGAPVHLPDCGVDNAEVFDSFKKLSGKDGRVHFYTHFGSDDPQVILDTIRFLVTVRNCKYVFLDHITMIVTGMEGDDERKKLDYISTKLATMVRDYDFSLFLVSHVNDDGKTRGSRNIAKVADILVHFERDIENPNAQLRNRTYITVRGNRYAGITGPGGILRFNPKTFKLEELMDEDDEDPDFEG